MNFFIRFKYIISMIGALLVLNTALPQESSVINDSIFSQNLNEQRKIKIYLPEEYKPGSDTKYDVVYITDGETHFDGSKFYINGLEIIDNDGLHGSDWYKSYGVPMQKGYYPVRLEYFVGESKRHLDIIYISPDTHETVNMAFKMMYFK